MSERCSTLARDEPLIGTAPRARAWLVLEQPGPYGFHALTESHLPDPVRAALGSLPKDTGTTVLLARRVGHHADTHDDAGSRRFWFAHTHPGGVRMRTGVLDDTELLRPDLADTLASAADGPLPPWGTTTRESLLLVCTNSRRDICCAIKGRPLADALAADPACADRVLEVSHLGGHRFSPTALLLPWGHCFGRLDVAAARTVLEAADRGRLAPLHHHRGRGSASQPVQVAAHAERLQEGIDGLDDLDALRRVGGRAVPAPLRWQGEDDGVAEVEIRHRDGRSWHVAVRRSTLTPARPESCGKAPVEPHVWTADAPVPAPGWL